MSYRLTRAQARRFLLRLHGLIGEPVFEGEAGVLAFARQAGCIQFDPIDACGQNAQLVLQSRVKGFKKPMLDKLLYTDRALVDYFDKNLAIWPTENWPYFARERQRNREAGRSLEAVNAAIPAVLAHIGEHGPACSKDLALDEKVHWYWSNTRLGRAVLETLYFRGELVVHRKKRTVKYYDLPEKHLPKAVLEAADPIPDDWEYVLWNVARRVGSVGLLQNKGSDALLGVDGLKGGGRERAFKELLARLLLIEVQIDDIKEPFYCLARDEALLREVAEGAEYAPRCVLIAPLDNLMWDRRVIRQLFGFDYTWEIYTPQARRRYGYYVLPVLVGERLVGRIEPVRDSKAKTLYINGFWPEADVAMTRKEKTGLMGALKAFAAFNDCKTVMLKEGVSL